MCICSLHSFTENMQFKLNRLKEYEKKGQMEHPALPFHHYLVSLITHQLTTIFQTSVTSHQVIFYMWNIICRKSFHCFELFEFLCRAQSPNTNTNNSSSLEQGIHYQQQAFGHLFLLAIHCKMKLIVGGHQPHQYFSSNNTYISSIKAQTSFKDWRFANPFWTFAEKYIKIFCMIIFID
jgi:hypothetical protein